MQRRTLIAQFIALMAVLLIVLPTEYSRWQSTAGLENRVSAFATDFNIDTTLPFVLLLALPFFALRCSSRMRRSLLRRIIDGLQLSISKPVDAQQQKPWATVFLAVVVFSTSLAASLNVANTPIEQLPDVRLRDLPPAYHDEYSYLLQANTLLAGRLSYESHAEMPRLFDQMHVLNEGLFVSRYPIGTGTWIAIAIRFGDPYWGHWLAGALAATFVFAIGRELSGNGVGFLAGMLTSLAPAMGIFSNLLLAHHPTVMSLTFFAWMFVCFQKSRLPRHAMLAGCGLAFAMLCRPMTAAGIGLPFGIWFAIYACRRQQKVASDGTSNSATTSKWKNIVALSLPMFAGFAVTAAQNLAITGSATKLPWQVYTEIYTPSHAFGFDNVERGKLSDSERVIENYDKWAKNLTPELAVENVQNRLIASSQWSLGLVPIVAATVVFLIAKHDEQRWWGIAAAIISLHIAHIPYWYAGIMNFHYVFESVPFLLLIVARATEVQFQSWRQADRHRMPQWWLSLLAASLLITYVGMEPFWASSRLDAGIGQIKFPRRKYYGFQQMVEREVIERPAIVIVHPDPADRHIDFVVNDATLDGEVLYARHLEDVSAEQIRSVFLNRVVYEFFAITGQLSKAPEPRDE